MSAKFIYTLSDENPDLQKQIGCMNGIFQLFDRHHFLGGGRRITSQNHKKLRSGQNGNNVIEIKGASQKTTSERNHKAAVKEKHRTSTESSRTSFSSTSCSSSISSLECSKASQQEPSSFSQNAVTEIHDWNSQTYHPNASLHSSQQSFGFRDVGKGSIYGEARTLSVKTATKGEARGQNLKYIDSPRPLQHHESINSKASGLKESFRVLHKLQEAPCKSCDGKNGRLKDARRLSYDGRESRDMLKSTIKLKELPRLSLDSRAGSTRGSNPEMKSNSLLGDFERGNGNSDSFLDEQQELGSYKRPSSVVAKLMGLEALPDPISASGNQTRHVKTHPVVENELFRRPRTTCEDKQNQISSSPRNLCPISPSKRNAASVKKPTANMKFPIELAPWRQPDGSKGSQATALKSQAPLTKAPDSSLSVYGEIERRLAQLEFKKSGKDLRALKQILEAMQKTKEILEARKAATSFETRTSGNNSLDQSSNLVNLKDLQSSSPISVPSKGTSSPKGFRSPIVIMKPAKLIGKASNPASALNSTTCSSSIQRLQTGAPKDGRNRSVDKRTAKDLSPRTNHLTDTFNKTLNCHPIDKSTVAKSSRLAQISENGSTTTEGTNSAKRSGVMNLKQQQKKLGLEKQSHPRNASSNRTRSQPCREPTESGSPRRKPRPRSPNLQPCYDELSDISDLRDLSHPGDVASLQSDSNISLASQVDDEVSSTDRSVKINRTFIQHAQCRQKNLAASSTKDTSIPEPRPASSEQPSPVSVLDATFYSDELPSPIRKISIAFKDNEVQTSDEVQWIPVDANYSSSSMNSSSNSKTNHKNAQNIQPLIQKLREILSTHEERIADKTTSLYNSTNPDHQYIAQICLASGIQEDFEFGFTAINLHPSGIPISTNLFHALEQAKAISGHFNDEFNYKKNAQSEAHAKIQRRVVFDVVNEILANKLLRGNPSRQWFSINMLDGKRLRGQKLLGELCSEVDRLQGKNSYCLLDDDDDLMHQSNHWTGCHDEIPGIVLDVERLVFKDLITEVISEIAGRRGRLTGHRRQLFLE